MKTAAGGHNDKTLESKNSNGSQESETIRVRCAPEAVWRESYQRWIRAPKQCYWSAPEQHTDTVLPLYQCHDLSEYTVLQSRLKLEDSLRLKWGPLCQQQETWTQKSFIYHSKRFDIWAPFFFFWLINWVTSLITDISTYMACWAASNLSTTAATYCI